MTTLYRFYGADGELLYVGITASVGRRLREHAEDKNWYGDIVGATFDHYESRAEALEAEAEAIRYESPLWNIVGRVDASPLAALPGPDPDDDRLRPRDYLCGWYVHG